MKNFKIYNSLTRKKEAFKPIKPGQIGLYVCGVTPYDDSHIGHARVYVVFDTLYRFLKANGWSVTYVRNFTDVDDKIINRANEIGRTPERVAQTYITSYQADMFALNVLDPDHEPRVTTHIPEIINLISLLERKGVAYRAENGDVYYDITKYPGYGDLAGKNIEDLMAGARVEVNKYKRNPGDFALWKDAKLGDPAWESPWGHGRPGWHIECSAMSKKYLGEHFDIHGGGEDLQFPHHSNEIAQSEGAHGCKYVNYWMHNAFITVDNEKMSKSLGNFTTIKSALEKYPGEAIRLWILQTHYRKPVDFSDDALEAQKNALDGLYGALNRAVEHGCDVVDQDAIDAVYDDLADDLNTARALSRLFEQGKKLNIALKEGDHKAASIAKCTLKEIGRVLGVLQQNPVEYLHGAGSENVGLDEVKIEALIAERNEARDNKNFSRSDQIRDELAEQGIILEDGPGGTTWKRA